MKRRLLLAIAMLGLFVPAVEKASAADVSINFFYDTLGGDGNWVEMGNYGYVWQPSVAVGNASWRPYADGYWAYTDLGWTWVSYEDFGWATYHYGRWVRLRDRGWFWVPGYTWAPAWVSWRTGGDYIGWAPLPPDFRDEVVYEGRPVYGYIDTDYDIGPGSYNFVDIRYIGEPVLRERIFEPAQNVVYMESTVNVTNITYNNNVVYNYGPDYNAVSAYSTRPVLRMAVQRENVADPVAAARSGALMQKQGDKLIVGAPSKLEKPVATTPPPKTVKEKIAQPTFEKGWSGVGDQSKVAQLKQKIKAENPKQVPPPDFKPRAGASVAASAAAAPPRGAASLTPSAPVPATPAQSNGKGKDKRAEPAVQPSSPGASTAAASAVPAALPAMTAPPRGKAKTKHGETAPVIAAPAAPVSAAQSNPGQPNAAFNAPAQKDKGKRQHTPATNVAPNVPVPEGGSAAPEIAPPASAAQPQHAKGNANKARPNDMMPQANPAPNAPPPLSQPSELQPSGGKHHGAPRESIGGTPAQQPPPRALAPEAQGAVQRQPMPAMPPPGGQGPGEQHPQKGEKPKKGGPHDSPPPGQ
jgi:hypothetical protein